MVIETSTSADERADLPNDHRAGLQNGDLDSLEAFVAHDIVEHQEGATSGIDGLRTPHHGPAHPGLGPAPRDRGHRNIGRHRVVPHPCDRHQRRADVGPPADRAPVRHHRHGRHANCRRPDGRALGRRRPAGGPQADRAMGGDAEFRFDSAKPDARCRLPTYNEDQTDLVR